MGWNTTVVILNDALTDIRNDPQFGQRLYHAIVSHHTGDSRISDVPAGCHANAALVVEQHHADGLIPVLVGGNSGQKLDVFLPWDTKPEDAELKLLQQLARKHGYSLRRKAKRKAA